MKRRVVVALGSILAACGGPSAAKLGTGDPAPAPVSTAVSSGGAASVPFNGQPDPLPRQPYLPDAAQLQATEQVFADAITAAGKKAAGCIPAISENKLAPFTPQLLLKPDGAGGAILNGPCQVDGTQVVFSALDLHKANSKGVVLAAGQVSGQFSYPTGKEATLEGVVLTAAVSDKGSSSMQMAFFHPNDSVLTGLGIGGGFGGAGSAGAGPATDGASGIDSGSMIDSTLAPDDGATLQGAINDADAALDAQFNQTQQALEGDDDSGDDDDDGA
jgi:hypothetical protein